MLKVKQVASFVWRRLRVCNRKAPVFTLARTFIAGTLGISVSIAAEFASFDGSEYYVADGVRYELKQVKGEFSARRRVDDNGRESDVAGKAAVGPSLQRGAALYKDVPLGDAPELFQQMREDVAFDYVYPVYENPSSGLKAYLNNQIIIRIKEGANPGDVEVRSQGSIKLVETLSSSENMHLFELVNPKRVNPFKVCSALRADDVVLWTEPNLTSEVRASALPNDTLFGTFQWNLRNTFNDADIDADDAWDQSQGYGSPGIRIAVLDTGVQTAHPDLSANILQGYDFYSGDSDANPVGSHAHAGHGTSVAGLAAAAVNNAAGVAGVAGKCKILPVRIIEGATAASNADIYRALVYAADNADVIVFANGITASSTITSGFSYASSPGRNGKGCAVFTSSGNSASGQGTESYLTLWELNLSLLPAANYRAEWTYKKNAANIAGADCVRLASIVYPNGTAELLNSATLPTGWSTSGSANWTGSIDPEFAHGTTAYTWRSGSIGNNQSSSIRSALFPVTSTAGTLYFRAWISSEVGDVFELRIYNSAGVLVAGPIQLDDGGEVASRTTTIQYPASLAVTLAAGASTDFDYRSDYSQFGSELDFLAPSDGGFGTPVSTDRTGTDGYDPTRDYSYFGGTSAAAPTAAGAFALILSKDGNLTKSAAVSKLTQTCDKIGPVAYTGTAPLTRNDYYGHGRINANSALTATTADTTAPTFNSASVANYRAVDVLFNEPMGEGAETPGNYTLTAGAGTLSSNPSRVVRLTPSIYRLIWTSGDIATSGTVTIQAASGIKDVAGNSLGSAVSRSSTGTKRIVGVQCGAIPSDGPGYLYFGPYHMDTVEFLGNEYVGKTVTGSSHVSNYTYNSINMSGISDPAPENVYRSFRQSTSGATLTYVIPNIPSGNKDIRLHFSENYYSAYNAQKFDVKVNGVTKLTNVDIYALAGGSQYRAVTSTISAVAPDANGKYTIEFIPVSSTSWTASVNAIEVLNP